MPEQAKPQPDEQAQPDYDEPRPDWDAKNAADKAARKRNKRKRRNRRQRSRQGRYSKRSLMQLRAIVPRTGESEAEYDARRAAHRERLQELKRIGG